MKAYLKAPVSWNFFLTSLQNRRSYWRLFCAVPSHHRTRKWIIWLIRATWWHSCGKAVAALDTSERSHSELRSDEDQSVCDGANINTLLGQHFSLFLFLIQTLKQRTGTGQLVFSPVYSFERITWRGGGTIQKRI